MRVLLLTIEYPPHLIGGLGTHTADLSMALAAAGHEVDVVTVDPRSTSPSVEARGRVRVHRGVCSPYPKTWEQVVPCANIAMERVVYEMDQRRYQIIHMHERSSLFSAQTAARRFSVPVVYTAHSVVPKPRHDGDRAFDLALEAGSLSLAACTMGVSTWVCEQLAQRYHGQHLEAVPNGVFPNLFAPTVPVRVPGESMVFVGRLVRRKGLHCLLTALVGLERRVPGWSLRVLGDGPERAVLERMAQELGIGPRVHFCGQVGRPEVAAALDEADLGVFPSLVEPFGIVVIEAMAHGVPVVTSDRSGIARIFTPGEHGWQADVEDPECFADSLVDALTSPSRPFRAAAALDLVRDRYTWDRVAAQIVRVYESV